MKTFKHSISRILKSYHGDKGLTVVTGGNLDFTKRFIEKIHTKEKSQIIILYKDYEELKDDYYANLEKQVREIEKSNLKLLNKMQVFNCNIANQDDKDEFIFFLENNNFKVFINVN